MSERIVRISLNSNDINAIVEAINKAFGTNEKIPVAEAIFKAAVFARHLPDTIVESLMRFKLFDEPDGLIIDGTSIDSMNLPETPKQIIKNYEEFAFKFDFVHLMFSSILGEVFTFQTIQFGNIINDVIPLSENARLPISSGFENDFGLHTEDAFSPYSGEFLGLLCLRNPSLAPTIISSIRDVSISDKNKEILFQERFLVKHNIAHERKTHRPKRISILFGSVEDPYLRINANYNAALSGDTEAETAYQELVSGLNAASRDVILHPGDFFYINNRVAAHGRRKYHPKWNGQDRWLRRLYITTDLKRSRHIRNSANGRVIGAH